MDFDPDIISYRALLDVFWRSHNPARRAWSRQYMAVIFYHDEAQRVAADDTFRRETARQRTPIETQMQPFSGFHLAEDYHQKYSLRQIPALITEFAHIYPDCHDLVNSTAVARVNGFVSGYGSPETLRHELAHYGLSAVGQQVLSDLSDRYHQS